MKRILVSVTSLFWIFFAICRPAFAEYLGDQRNAMQEITPQLIYWTITAIGLFIAVRLARQAFGREVKVADISTFPICMTSRRQYKFGEWTFAMFSCAFFLLLIYEHRQVMILMKPLNIIPDYITAALEDKSASYLIIVAAMGAVYLYCLTYDSTWNPLLHLRDVVRNWISVPRMVANVMAQIKSALIVPTTWISAVVDESNGIVSEDDFHKNVDTPDRQWAEICYMKLWLEEREKNGTDATFFYEDSFGYRRLVRKFAEVSELLKSGSCDLLNVISTLSVISESNAGSQPNIILTLHTRFSMLVSCYLIYRNGTKSELYLGASEFGIKLSDPISENPLRYWIVYMIALAASVFLGAHFSAIGYDLLVGKGLNPAQDPNLPLNWVMYSASNYGLSIVAILLFRLFLSSFGSREGQSHLITYCWTAVIGFLVGPAGLTLTACCFASHEITDKPIYVLYGDMLKWGIGPAAVSVYISYYLDRQTYADMPEIDHSAKTFVWRLLNCFAFATITLFVLLSPLLALKAGTNAVYSTSKLQFVASATTFCIALGLAIAAQFCLRKNNQFKEPIGQGSSGGRGDASIGEYSVRA
jgi:hypothetical protein